MSPPQEADDRLVRVGLADGEVQRTVAPGGLLSFTIRAGDLLWAVWLKAWPDGPAELLEIDWETGEVKGRVPVGNNARDLVYADGYIWATTGTDGTVQRIDPETREVVGEPIQIGFALGIAAGEGAVLGVRRRCGVLGDLISRPRRRHASRSAASSPGSPSAAATTGCDTDQGSTASTRRLRASSTAPSLPRPGPSGRRSRRADGLDRKRKREGTVLALDARTGTRLGDPVKIGTGSQNISVTAVTQTSVWAEIFPDRTVPRNRPGRCGSALGPVRARARRRA